MSTQKRRVVWMDDESWADLGRRADLRGISPSAYIRASLGGGFIIPDAILKDPAFAASFGAPRPAPKPSKRGSK